VSNDGPCEPDGPIEPDGPWGAVSVGFAVAQLADVEAGPLEPDAPEANTDIA